MNLNERPTPLTEALRIKIITDPTMDGGDRLVAVLNHARDLERSLAERTEERDAALAKLVECREALARLEQVGILCQRAEDARYSDAPVFARQTLEETK